ncbi:MAG: AraC family transcriptional regulator [Bacteroidia bacterium]|nr:AraC family transcriptional regulator [Bacteroidia bacterium]
MQKYQFYRDKYQTELLIDCFEKSKTLMLKGPTKPFLITFYEIIFVTAGQGKFALNDEQIEVKAGTILLLPPNKWRQWVEMDKNFDGIYLIFEEEFISTFFNDALFLYRFHYFYNTSSPSYVSAETGDLARFMASLNEIRLEIKSLKADSNHLLRALLYLLLIHINRLYERNFDIKGDFYEDTLILKFRRLLEQNLKSKQRVSEYAQMLEVSQSHLNKLLKSYFGKSCSEIIKERLLIEVKKELLFTKKNLSEIAFELGFSEPSNFNRFFREMTGLTPKSYRLQNLK